MRSSIAIASRVRVRAGEAEASPTPEASGFPLTQGSHHRRRPVALPPVRPVGFQLQDPRGARQQTSAGGRARYALPSRPPSRRVDRRFPFRIRAQRGSDIRSSLSLLCGSNRRFPASGSARSAAANIRARSREAAAIRSSSRQPHAIASCTRRWKSAISCSLSRIRRPCGTEARVEARLHGDDEVDVLRRRPGRRTRAARRRSPAARRRRTSSRSPRPSGPCPSGTQRSSEMFGRPGRDVDRRVRPEEVVLRAASTSPSGTYGTLPLPSSADARTGPIWLENVGRHVEHVRVRVDVDHLAEAGMGDRAVVALEVVLERDLPVRLDRPLVMRVEAERREVEPARRDDRRQLAERLGERRRVGVGVDEDERAPGVDGDRQQREVGRGRSRARAPSAAPGAASRRARTSRRGRGTGASRGSRSPFATRCARWRQTLTNPRSTPVLVAHDDDRDVPGLRGHERARARRPARPGRRTARRARRSARARAPRRRGRSTTTPAASSPPRAGARAAARGGVGLVEVIVDPDCPVSQDICGPPNRSRYAER